MDKRQPTAFEKTVYDAVSKIPKGRVTTYKLLGRAIGCESAQAVGQALKRNPFAPRVPCHRVIASNLAIGGYSGRTGGAAVNRKLKLLRGEGVEFHKKAGRPMLTDSSTVFNFE